MSKNPLSYTEAKAVAEDAADPVLRPFVSARDAPLLEDRFLESDACWIFFRRRTIAIPPEALLHAGWAYAVSKDGEVRQIIDYFDEPEKARDYLRTISKFFSTRRSDK